MSKNISNPYNQDSCASAPGDRSVCYPTNLVVEFRPKNNHQYHFGFDWFRVDDIGVEMQTNNYAQGEGGEQQAGRIYKDFPYEKAIESGYGNLSDKDALKKFKKLYESYDAGPREGYSDKTYYVPYLNLFSEDAAGKLTSAYNPTVSPPFTAELRLIIYASGVTAKDLKFVYPKEFRINGQESPYYWGKEGNKSKGKESKTDFYIRPEGPKNYDKAATITVSCLEDIKKDEYLEVYALYDDEDYGKKGKVLAGKLCLCANELKKLNTAKVTMIEVSLSGKNRRNEFNEVEIKRLYHILYQALVIPDVDTVILKNLAQYPEWQESNGKFIVEGGLQATSVKEKYNVIQSLQKIFFDELAHAKKGRSQNLEEYDATRAYKESVLAFTLPIKSNDIMNAGFTYKATFVTMLPDKFIKSSDIPLAHETLHALGLAHSFGFPRPLLRSALYTFKNDKDTSGGYHTTDNIMSNSPSGRNTWKWQWEILQKASVKH